MCIHINDEFLKTTITNGRPKGGIDFGREMLQIIEIRTVGRARTTLVERNVPVRAIPAPVKLRDVVSLEI